MTASRKPWRRSRTRPVSLALRARRLRALIGAVAALALGSGAGAAPTEITFAVEPQFGAETIFETWGPVLHEVGARAGVKLRLETYRSIPEFERSLRRGAPDLAYVNPYHALLANRVQGYAPFLRDESRPLRGILVVRADSKARSVRDLDGEDIAFAAPNAFPASLYVRALLREKEGIRFQPRYVSTHANAYRHVILGKAAAGGGIEQTLEFEPPEVRSQLRILYTAPPTPSQPVVAHPRLAKGLVDGIALAFHAVASQPEHGKLLTRIQFGAPRATDLREYLPLQKLRLDPYVVPAGP